MDCTTCHNEIANPSDLIICNGVCSGNFHLACTGLPDNSRKLNTAQKKKWVCVACSKINKTDAKEVHIEPTESSIGDIPALLEKFNKNLMDVMSTKFEELKQSLDYNSQSIQELKDTIKLLQESNNNLKIAHESMKKENLELKKELSVVKQDVIDLKQYSRRLNVEISNLPEIENEDIESVVESVMSVLDVDHKNDLVAYHRVPTMNKSKIKPIILRFNSALTKANFMKNAKHKNVHANQINSNLSPEPIYFNDHLCPEIKKLLFQCKVFKRENKFKFC